MPRAKQQPTTGTTRNNLEKQVFFKDFFCRWTTRGFKVARLRDEIRG